MGPLDAAGGGGGAYQGGGGSGSSSSGSSSGSGNSCGSSGTQKSEKKNSARARRRGHVRSSRPHSLNERQLKTGLGLCGGTWAPYSVSCSFPVPRDKRLSLPHTHTHSLTHTRRQGSRSANALAYALSWPSSTPWEACRSPTAPRTTRRSVRVACGARRAVQKGAGRGEEGARPALTPHVHAGPPKPWGKHPQGASCGIPRPSSRTWSRRWRAALRPPRCWRRTTA